MPRPPACFNSRIASYFSKRSKDGKYINNYIPTIILHVYFSNVPIRLLVAYC